MYSGVPFWNETQAGLEGRGDPDDYGGFVADYSWINNNEAAYDSFHSTSDGTSFFAANVGGWMIATTTIAACAEFSDSDGGLANGARARQARALAPRFAHNSRVAVERLKVMKCSPGAPSSSRRDAKRDASSIPRARTPFLT